MTNLVTIYKTVKINISLSKNRLCVKYEPGFWRSVPGMGNN